MKKLTFKKQWHNLYFAVNTLIWTGLILLLALLFTRVFLSVSILLGACAAISVLSSAVLLKPGHRLVAGIVQGIAWGILITLSLVLYKGTVKPVILVFLPAAALSIGTLVFLGSFSLRTERNLRSAMKRG